MSFNQCTTCKHASVCTFPRNREITGCDEYEGVKDTPPRDWDLRDLLELGQAVETRQTAQ